MPDAEILSAPLVLEYPFKRTVGPDTKRVLDRAARGGLVLGVRAEDGRVYARRSSTTSPAPAADRAGRGGGHRHRRRVVVEPSPRPASPSTAPSPGPSSPSTAPAPPCTPSTPARPTWWAPACRCPEPLSVERQGAILTDIACFELPDETGDDGGRPRSYPRRCATSSRSATSAPRPAWSIGSPQARRRRDSSGIARRKILGEQCGRCLVILPPRGRARRAACPRASGSSCPTTASSSRRSAWST